MTACTSFLAFFAEQTLAFAEKMHSRPDRWPQIVRFASGRANSLANQRFVNDQTLAQRFIFFMWRSSLILAQGCSEPVVPSCLLF